MREMLTSEEVERLTVALMTAVCTHDKPSTEKILVGVDDPEDLRRLVYCTAFLFRAFSERPQRVGIEEFLRFVGLAVAKGDC